MDNQHVLTAAALLPQFVALTQPAQRAAASQALATALGADDLVLFVRDQELDVLLPAPGFQVTLTRGNDWRAFLAECVRQGRAQQELSLRRDGPQQLVTGISPSPEVVLVLAGASLNEALLEAVAPLLPLLAVALQHEQALKSAEAQTALARRASEENRLLATMLDGARTELQHALQNVEALNRQKDEFLSVVAHELRTPLTSLSGNIQLLVREQNRQPPDATHTADAHTSRVPILIPRLQLQMTRLVALVDSLLDISRITAGQLDLRPVAINVPELVRETVDEQRLAHPTRELTEEFVLGDRAIVVADPERVRQVLTNFLTNALKYSPPTSAVHVRVACDASGCGGSGDVVCVSVRDHGPGIPQEQLGRVWALYHRVPGIEVLSGSGVGLGLGLHIAKSMIERQGGSVGVESTLGGGSTFWFTLPLASSLRKGDSA